MPRSEAPRPEPYVNGDRRVRKMERIDALPGPIKQVVHEYGWLTVKTLLECGVSDPKKMKILIKTILYEHSHEYRVLKQNAGGK